ncbi:MAG: hypothetical protein HFJ01_05165 [Lachnospiraceae bacterium]|jgi:hypothetical protein|nr:hypothetical protein [Lachnospiraceae bacterium]
MKRKYILIFMIVLAMGMTACSSKSKEDAVSEETDSLQEADKKETEDTKTTDAKTIETKADDVESPNPETAQEDGEVSLKEEEIPQGDPIVGIVEKYEGNTITIRTPEDDMLYYFSTENVPILEGFSTESAHTAEGDSQISVGDKVEVSYRGLIDFDEEHPDEAVKIVVITVE